MVFLHRSKDVKAVAYPVTLSLKSFDTAVFTWLASAKIFICASLFLLQVHMNIYTVIYAYSIDLSFCL